MARHAPFGAGGQQVADADVGERAAGHHAVVAAAGAVAVEIQRLDAVLLQVFARRALRPRSTRPGEMWSVVTESPSTASTRAPAIGLIGAGFRRQVDQERRLLNVRALGVPVVTARLRWLGSCVPRARWRPKTFAVPLRGTSRQHDRLDRGSRLRLRAARCPSGKTGLPSLPVAQRLVRPDRYRPCRPGHRPRPAADWPDNSPCTSGLMRPSKLRLPLQHGRGHQIALGRRPWPPARAAGRCCRCRSCSRSRRC